MRHRLFTLLCAVVAVAISAAAWAHEGHAHKVMGTVTMAAADHVMIETTDGKDETITVNAKTKIVRGKTTILFVSVRPLKSSCDFLLVPSTSTCRVWPTRF